MSYARFFALAAICLTLAACSPRQKLSADMPDLAEAPARWEKFQAASNRPAEPFLISGSLRFGQNNNTSRVTYTMWGNENPLRLDIQAGMGSTVAKMQSGNGLVLTLLPGENKAYVMQDTPASALSLLKLPLPLTMTDMALFLRGNYAEALGQPTWSSVEAGADNVLVYRMEGGASGLLGLDEAGLPRIWQSADGWNLEVETDDSGLPVRLDGSFQNDYRLVLLVKERQNPPVFTAQQVDLALPKGVKVYSLESSGTGDRP